MQKYLKRGLIAILIIFIQQNSYAQNGLNFQGVARSSNNVILASQSISLRLSILQGSANGNLEYSEIRKVTTNTQGLFSVVIGDEEAASTIGNFAAINWKNTPKYLKIELDPNAGNNFITIGTTQFQYVAYAQFAKSVDALNITGVIPVEKGGTGVSSIASLKTALAIDKSSIGLSNVDNTSDLSKPISTATQIVLDTKASISYVNKALSLKINADELSSGLLNKVDKVVGKQLSSNDFTTAEKTKLASISGINTGDQDLSNYATNIDLSTKESITNKSTASDLGGLSSSDILYPTQKAVKLYVDANNSSGGISDGSITTIKLADGAVNDSKLSNGLSKSKVGLGNVENTALSTWSGSGNLNTLGIITSGTWNGTTIGSNVGGAGTVNGLLKANGSGVVSAAVAGIDFQSPLTSIQSAILSNTSGINTGDETSSSIKTKLGINNLSISGNNNDQIQILVGDINSGELLYKDLYDINSTLFDDKASLTASQNIFIGDLKAKTFILTNPSTITANTSTTNINLSSGNVLEVLLNTNTTLSFSNPRIGTYIIKIKQDAIGGKVVSFPTMKWADDIVPVITAAANRTDLLTIIYDGINYYGTCLQNF